MGFTRSLPRSRYPLFRRRDIVLSKPSFIRSTKWNFNMKKENDICLNWYDFYYLIFSWYKIYIWMKKDRTEIYLRIERIVIPSLFFEFNSKNGYSIKSRLLFYFSYSYFQNWNEYAINHCSNKMESAFWSVCSDLPMSANL